MSSVAGFPAVFEVLEGADYLSTLTPREARIFVGAANFHALMAPGRELPLHVYSGEEYLTPRTTDDRSFDGASRVFRRRVVTIVIRSTAVGDGMAGGEAANALLSERGRHVFVSADSALSVPPRRWQPRDPVRRALRRLRTRHPLAYDQLRDLELLRFRRSLRTPARRRDYGAEFEVGGVHEGLRVVPVGESQPDAPAAVLIGMHWFELGGAEHWALESVRIVREAGFLPVVVSNVDSHHPFINRPELDGALVVPFSEPTSNSQTTGVEEFLRGLLTTFNVRGVIVHHNQWLYDRLPWLRASRPGLPVIDSTHIVEYRGGGYPMSSVRADRYIDTHHVISPALKRWFVGSQGIDERKVVMAPLGGLTVDIGDSQFRERDMAEPLAVAFVGRMSRQKSPEMFLAMAGRLHAARANVRFIVHGDGELDDWVADMISAFGVESVTIRRTSQVPVSRTLDEAGLLVVSSHNEGLTLTTLEAIAHGVPVISTDVGAQSDVVPPSGLFTKAPHAGVREAALLVSSLERDEASRRRLWELERKRERELLSNTSATDWLAGVVSTW